MMATEPGTPAMIDCETAARALYDFLDGRLAASAHGSVQMHIDTCRNCAPHFAFARRLLASMPASLPLTDVSPDLRARVVASLKAEGFTAP